MLMVAVLGRQGRLAALKGDYLKAKRFLTEGVDLARQMDFPLGLSEYLIPYSGLAIYQGDYQSAERYLKEALVLGEQFNNSGAKVHASYYLAELALHRKELADAVRLLVDSLKLTLSDPEWQKNFTNHEFNTERLIIAGKLANALDDYSEATWLLSAGEAIRAQSNYLLDPLAREEYEQAVQRARDHLAALFEQAWQEGATLTEEEAIHRAIAYLERTQAQGPQQT
jgi:tetratricopeptide (TPR) repeat protein